MEITQDPKLQADRILSATVARTDAILRSASGRTALEATWLLNGHNGHSNLILKLKNPQGYLSSAEFDPAEFRNEPGISLRMEDLNAALARIAHWRSIVDELFERLRPWCERGGDP